jgi:uncharacterized repeat protein (TIGR04076 family)
VAVRIVVTGGECQGKVLQVGQTFTAEWTTPEGFCTSAWQVISPYIMTLLCGGTFAFEAEKGVVNLHCPDPKGITVELRRI